MIARIRSLSLYKRLNRRGTLGQFIKYGIVGVGNVALFLTIFNLLRVADVPVLAANACGFLVASINSFVWNKRWTFRDARRHAVVGQYFIFLTFTLVGLGINTGALSLFLVPLRGFGRIGENIAVLCALPFSVAWNFASYRLWIFRHHSHSGRVAQDSASAGRSRR